jgi:hypothetical protein
MTKPGAYDIAAIRYGYANTVELENSKVFKLDTHKPIDNNLENNNVKIKKYKFCSDEHAYYGTDPMCRKFDVGTTPIEVVTDIINSYDTMISTQNYRFDRAYSSSSSRIFRRRLRLVFEPLYKFYTQWRVLVAEALGANYKYFDRIDANEYNRKINELINNNSAISADLKEYKTVSAMILNFLNKIASAPPKSCVVRNEKGKLDLINLEPVRDELFYNKKISINSCNDDEFVNYIKQKGYTLETKNNTLNPEIGFFLNSIQFDRLANQKANDSSNVYDIIGMYTDRYLASVFLTSRFVALNVGFGLVNIQALKMKLFPNILDEPDKKLKIVTRYLSHIFAGQYPILWDNTITPFLTEDELAEFKERNINFPKFALEKDLLKAQMDLFFDGLQSYENLETTQYNFIPFQGSITKDSIPALDERAELKIQLPGLYFYVLNRKQNFYSYTLANIYQDLDKRRKTVKIQDPELVKLIHEEDSKLPSEETLKKMKFSELLQLKNNIYDDFKKFLEKNNSESTKNQVTYYLDRIYEFNILIDNEDAVNKVLELKPADADAEKKISDFKEKLKTRNENSALDEFNKIAKGKTFYLYSGKFGRMINIINSDANYYEKNQLEIDSQMDLIFTTLLSAN